MPKAFKMYRIVCTITDKALISGSDYPHDHRGAWHQRGYWGDGAFWKTEEAVKKHLYNLCHDWDNKHEPVPWTPRYPGEHRWWREIIPGSLDWSRLQHLAVDTFHVTSFSTVKISANDFMGIPERSAA